MSMPNVTVAEGEGDAGLGIGVIEQTQFYCVCLWCPHRDIHTGGIDGDTQGPGST